MDFQPVESPLISQQFQLLYLKKSKECVVNLVTNSIPSTEERTHEEYAFNSYPPKFGDVPIPPDIFMRIFLNPDDNLGCLATEVLPKKLRHELRWDKNVNNAGNIPYGWGFYIEDGFNWVMMTWCIVGITTVISVFGFWKAPTWDFQSAMALGAFLLGVLAVAMHIV